MNLHSTTSKSMEQLLNATTAEEEDQALINFVWTVGKYKGTPPPYDELIEFMPAPNPNANYAIDLSESPIDNATPLQDPELSDWESQCFHRIRLCVLTHRKEKPAIRWDFAKRKAYREFVFSNFDWDTHQFNENTRIPPELMPTTIDERASQLRADAQHALIEIFRTGSCTTLHKERIRQLWLESRAFDDALKHPRLPIIKECLRHWIPSTKPETRSKQIMPGAMQSAQTTETQEELPLGLFANQGIEQQLIIPGIIKYDSSIVPAFPLDVYEASEGKPPERGGKGAPLAQRIWVNALLAFPYARREQHGGWRLTTTLRDIKDWAYPKDWNRTRYLPRIQAALKDVHNMRVYWERRLWNVVQVFAIPTLNTRLDDPLPLLVRLPDGMPGNGPMINVTIMRLLGVQSAAQFRAWIKLAYIWDDAKRKNGGFPIYTDRPTVLRNNRGQAIDLKGKLIPKGNWNHPHAVHTGDREDNPAAERAPVLNDDDLIRLFFDDKPVSAERHRGRLKTAKQELEDMIAKGYVIVRQLPKGVRILEPHNHK